MADVNGHAHKIATTLKHAASLFMLDDKPRAPLTQAQMAMIPLRLARTVFVNMTRQQLEETAATWRRSGPGMPLRRAGRICELLLKVFSEKSWDKWRTAALRAAAEARLESQSTWQSSPIQPPSPPIETPTPVIEPTPEPTRTQAELDAELQHWLTQRRGHSPHFKPDGTPII